MSSITNKLRTPSNSPKNSKTNFHKRDFSNNSNSFNPNAPDKCKSHLAEVYAAKKRIDMLTGEIEEKNHFEM